MADPFNDVPDLASVLVPIDLMNTAGAINAITANGVSLAEDTTGAWNSGTTYATGQQAHSPITHRVYESLKDNNTNHDPTVLANRTTATGVGTWWLDIGPTNRFAMFDTLISSQTSGASPLVVTLRPGPFNGFALFGLDGDTIAAEVRDAPGGNVIYTTGGDVPLEGSMPADYYEYFFTPFKPQTQFVEDGLQPYGSAEIKVTIKKGTGNAKIGMFSIGDLKPLGIPESNSSFEPRTYSYISEDAFGNTTIKKRPSAVNLSLQIKVAIEDVDDIDQTVQNLLGTPVAVVGSNAQFHTKLSTFGLVSGRMDYSTYPDRTLQLTVKGFT
jgi:hypothetical protein